MEWVVLIRYSEIAVKGPSTRARMESLLKRNIEDALASLGAGGAVEIADGRLILRDPKPDPRAAALASSRVFGVKSVSPALEVGFNSLEDLSEKAVEFFGDRVRGRIFRVRARRVGSHPFTSKDIEKVVGARLLEAGARGVNLEEPEYTAYVEVRGWRAYFYDEVIGGPGGLPVGSEGPVLLLFSGGFDSTAAAWLLMKRGSTLSLVYYDLGVRRALLTALDVALTLAREWGFGHDPAFYIADFNPVASRARGLVRPEYRVLAIRRAMMEHAALLARREGFEAIATGENIGQVASQTLRNMRLISEGIGVPVLRPLACFDKDETIALTRRIGLYEKSASQVEVCRDAPPPTPRGDPTVFKREYGKLSFDPESVDVSSTRLRNKSLEEALRELGYDVG